MEDFEKHNVQPKSNKRWRWKRKPKTGKDIKMKQLTSGMLASKITFIKFVSVTSTYVDYRDDFRTLSQMYKSLMSSSHEASSKQLNQSSNKYTSNKKSLTF